MMFDSSCIISNPSPKFKVHIIKLCIQELVNASECLSTPTLCIISFVPCVKTHVIKNVRTEKFNGRF